ncbi:hypothetical protein PPERSA_02290 [Pseudocohnilembus persalinus]|uniref:Uncharacterized protein n=1 Tax=Pseudocohnilembus persalinus TaxID=266149 RepID=A0A0V0QHT7_PSEPJ|nr:hypothetical protein PPERSA_02290 [Pseudocohnilembus persalinus]|eukprot:KRX01762.1 hypothetical protein PPERSA_02290 [Pseudocohnilembus persalinus]
MSSQEAFKIICDMINQQLEGNDDPSQVEQLSLDLVNIGVVSQELKQKIEEYSNLESLSLTGCQLRSLENFPKLDRLMRLELIDNKLGGNSLQELKEYKSLQSLSLGGNNIKQVDDLAFIRDLPNLFQLDLLNNEINNIENYRETIFKEFPQLGILDNQDQKGQEIAYGDTTDQEDDEEEEYEEEEEQGNEGDQKDGGEDYGANNDQQQEEGGDYGENPQKKVHI